MYFRGVDLDDEERPIQKLEGKKRPRVVEEIVVSDLTLAILASNDVNFRATSPVGQDTRAQ